MKLKDLNSPIVTLSAHAELPLQLIKEELKSRKFFNCLLNMGLDNCYYQPHLDNLILTSLGMNYDDDKIFDFYYEVIERHSNQITDNDVSITTHALEVCMELMEAAKNC